MDLIASTDALAAACRRLSQHPFVTVDTEFLRETTYYPKLCLIQMAGPDPGEAYLIDPLAEGMSLEPFMALMADPSVVKVFHSARQDLEIVWNLGGIVPAPLFDTQVAAMVCGYGDSVSYEQLTNDLAKAKIDKSSRFTDWSRRPLTDAQLTYALSDVTHLVKVYEALMAELEKNGRLEWLTEEMAVLTSPETYQADPDNAWRRLAGRLRKPREIAVLMEIAAWREREAQSTRRAARAHPQGRCGDRHRHLGARAAWRRWAACAPSRTASSAPAPAARSWRPWSGRSPAIPPRSRSRNAAAAATIPAPWSTF